MYKEYYMILNLVLGGGMSLEFRNLLFRPPLESVVKIWKRFCKRALYLQENYLIILKMALGEGIRQESRNFLLRPLLVSVGKMWKWFWKCALYL